MSKSRSRLGVPHRLLRRVSAIFTSKKGRIQTHNAGSNADASSSQSSVASFDFEIRRPSDLGTPCTSFSAQDVDEHSYSRPRTLSMPQLTLTLQKVERPGPISKLPSEVLFIILSLLPPNSIPSLALLSRQFYSTVQDVLYDHLDMRLVHQCDDLLELLASRPELADKVHTFICYSWPNSFYNTTEPGADVFSLPFIGKFTAAVKNMRNLTCLTLPSFELDLFRHDTVPRLQKITLLSHSMSVEQTLDIFIWLDRTGKNVTYLSFPNLQRCTDPETVPATNAPQHLLPSKLLITSLPAPQSLSLPKPESLSWQYPFTASTLLPSLTTLHATPDLIELLGHRSLKDVQLNINTTIYAGLRPSALMSLLRGISSLRLAFGPHIDRRTLEKVLSAAGAALGSTCPADEGGVRPKNKSLLHTLEIEVPWIGTDTEDEIYQILKMILLRFSDLHELLLYPPHFIDSLSNTDQAYQEISRMSDMDIDLTVHDHEHLHSWLACCPTLQRVLFLSGARWHR